MFRLVWVESVQVREDAEPVFDMETRVPSIPAKRSHIKTENPAPHIPRLHSSLSSVYQPLTTNR